MRAVNIVLKGEGYSPPKAWNEAENLLRTMGEACTPKAPIQISTVYFKCPACEELLKLNHEYCPACGQAIKW